MALGGAGGMARAARLLAEDLAADFVALFVALGVALFAFVRVTRFVFPAALLADFFVAGIESPFWPRRVERGAGLATGE